MLSSYPSGEILSARRKADNGRPKGDVIGKQSFPKRGTSTKGTTGYCLEVTKNSPLSCCYGIGMFVELWRERRDYANRRL